MAKVIMGFQIFLMLIFFTGLNVEANPADVCLNMLKIEGKLDFLKLAGEDHVSVFCPKIKGFWKCVNKLMKEEFGHDLKDLKYFLSGTDLGKAFTFIINVENIFAEICTEGTELHEEFSPLSQCFREINHDILETCNEQAADAYENFRDLHESACRKRRRIDERCVITAYEMGCLGAAIHKTCGDEVYETYKKITKRIGYFKSGLCSSDIISTNRISFEEALNMAKSRLIVDLKKRKK